MELTQRLECTQTLYGNQSEKLCPDQVAFLGICGDKYPVVRGPNKIGRDPDTCHIVLKLNSISRQHAVINVLNNSEYMLMDLDSANKTKLENKTLQPYIPYPIRNGNTVQFGQVFGIFRLLEDDNELPMTQAIDVPETPVVNRHKSKFNNVHITTVPESPDVSDKDDSFIMPSQPKTKETFTHKNINNIVNYSGKTLTVPKIGSKKIDNVYWNSSRKSESLNLQTNTTIGSLNGSLTLKPSETISSNSIHEVNTQIPNYFENNEITDSLYAAETQIPENRKSLNIYNMETQVSATDTVPKGREVQNQLSSDGKENDKSVCDIKTEVYDVDKTSLTNVKADNVDSENTNHDTSNEVIVFNEIDSQPFEEIFESQALLLPEVHLANKDNSIPSNDECATTERSTRNVRLKSDSSTDCEDDEIRLSQNVFEKRRNNNDDDVTDCEDIPNCQEQFQKPKIDDDLTDCEDDLFDNDDISRDNKNKHEGKGSVNFEDLPTQIVVEDPIPNTIKDENDVQFEDMLTQVIDKNDEEIVPFQSNPDKIEDILTQVIAQNETKQADKPIHFPTNLSVTPFKVPRSPLRLKKDQKISPKQTTEILKTKAHDEVYYASTQEVFDDLCSQKEVCLDEPKSHDVNITNDQRGPSDKRPIDINEKLNENFANVSPNKTSKRNVLEVAKLNKFGSGDSSSDVEITPKKVPHLTFMEIDLPNSQEIKSSVTLNVRNSIVELSSGSETENDSEQLTPILFHHKMKKNNDAKMNLSKKFEIDALPTRIITRVRKPTPKALNNADTSSNICKNILKPKFLTDQEENIDKEIITENISRLKNNASKSNEKSIKKDAIHINKKTKSDMKIKENKNKKSTEKKTAKSNDNNKTDVNTIDGYLTNTNSDKSVMTSRNTRSRSRRKADTAKKSTSPEKIIKTRSSKSIEKHDEKKTIMFEKVDKTKNNKSYEKDNERTSIVLEKVNRTKSNKTYEKSNEKNPILPEKHKEDNIELISEQTVRRSRRRKDKDQRNSKQNEKSTIYNLSSESCIDSSNATKRSAESYQLPSAKKAKLSSETLRPSKYTLDKQYVLFTAFPNEEVKSKLESLGAVIVNDVMRCTVVLTLQIKRTFKLLCAVGLGRPIVGPAWVQACVDAKSIVDPQQHIICDEETEKRFQFDLKKILRGRRNFLSGYKVSCTPKVTPNAQEMKMIVECSGGTFKEGGRNWLCVSCPVDKPLWPQYKRRGAVVVSTELILAGVLQQRLDIENHRLA